MSNPSFNTKKYLVPANGTNTVSGVGNFIGNFSSSTVADSVKLIIGSSNEVRFNAGDIYELPDGQTFDGLTLVNKTAADITVEVGLAIGKINTANAMTVNGVVATRVSNATTFNGTQDVTIGAAATQIKAANLNRRSITITALSTNTASIRVCGSNAAAADFGNEIQPGQAATFETTSAVWGYCTTAGQKVTITEICD